MIFEKRNLLQLYRLTDNIQLNYPIPKDEKEALDYLYFLDRTFYNNNYSDDLTDYEKLIYIEYTYPSNKKIQQLIKNIKENIANNFLLKYRYIARLTDDMYLNELTTTYKQGLIDSSEDRYLMLRGSKDCEYTI